MQKREGLARDVRRAEQPTFERFFQSRDHDGCQTKSGAAHYLFVSSRSSQPEIEDQTVDTVNDVLGKSSF